MDEDNKKDDEMIDPKLGGEEMPAEEGEGDMTEEEEDEEEDDEESGDDSEEE